MEHHRTLTKWMAMIVGSVILSGFILDSTTGVTGMLSFDKGPDVDLNPDLITEDDYRSSLGNGMLILLLLIIFQVAAYFLVTWELENHEKVEEMEL